MIIPVFERLNRSMSRTSWFLSIYEVDWPEVCRVFKDRSSQIEDAWYFLCAEKGIEGHWKATADGDGKIHLDEVLETMERITARCTRLWKGRQHQHPRVGMACTLGFSRNSRMSLELQRPSNLVTQFIPSHAGSILCYTNRLDKIFANWQDALRAYTATAIGTATLVSLYFLHNFIIMFRLSGRFFAAAYTRQLL
jgi:hypothetical protein